MPSPENVYVQRRGTRDSKDGEDGRRTPKGDIASILNRLRTDDDGSARERSTACDGGMQVLGGLMT